MKIRQVKLGHCPVHRVSINEQQNGSASLREGQPHAEKEGSKEELLVLPDMRGFWKGNKKQDPIGSSVIVEGGHSANAITRFVAR